MALRGDVADHPGTFAGRHPPDFNGPRRNTWNKLIRLYARGCMEGPELPGGQAKKQRSFWKYMFTDCSWESDDAALAGAAAAWFQTTMFKES